LTRYVARERQEWVFTILARRSRSWRRAVLGTLEGLRLAAADLIAAAGKADV
jgi:hypothetical protein